MNPEAHGYSASAHHEKDDFGDGQSDVLERDIPSVEAEEPSFEAESLPDSEQAPTPVETEREERLGDFDERLRLLEIERESAARDIEQWKSSSTTNLDDFRYRLPDMKIRLSTAEQELASSKLERDIFSADANTPEAADEVVRSFIKNQVLEGMTKSQRDGLRGIDKEEATLQGKLEGYEKTIEYSSNLLDGEQAGAAELSPAQRRDLIEKMHQTSDMYESVLAQKMSSDFGGKRTELEAQMKAIQEQGVPDEALPKTVQEDPDFAACLREAEFSHSEDSEAFKRRTNHDPEKEAVATFSKRFPHKAEFYNRLAVVAREEEPTSETRASAGEQKIDRVGESPVVAYESPREEAPAVWLEGDDSWRKETFTIKMEQSERELLKHITGLEADDPQVPERLIEDKARIRAKYDLPPLEMRSQDPAGYERNLRERMKKEGIEYKEAWEVGGFFEHHPGAGGVYMGKENVISAKFDRGDIDEYYSSLGTMEHELVHGLQKKYSENMPIELQEYEAYIGSNFNVERLRGSDDIEGDLSAMFGSMGGIKGSVDWWYQNQSEHQGRTVIPEWDSAKKKKQEIIEKYRTAIFTEDSRVEVDEALLQQELQYSFTYKDVSEAYTKFFSTEGRKKETLKGDDLAQFDAYLKKINPLLADRFAALLLESNLVAQK